MDYFSELLDSYDKLKKRTFKLRYISEAEEGKKDGKSSQEDMDAQTNKDAEAQAVEIVKAGPNQPFDDKYKRKGQPPYAYFSKKKNEVQLIGGPMGSRAGRVGDANGTPDVNSDGWKKLVNYFADGSNNAVDQEQIRQEKLKTIGGFFELEGINNPEAVRSMEKAKGIVDDFCLKNNSTESLKDFCGRAWTYFAAGNSKMGLEYKLGTAQAIQVLDPEAGTTEKAPASTALVAQAARSAAFLTSFLTKPDERKCKFVKDRIGLYKGDQLVLFGDEPNEGIVVGKPNAMHKLAFQKIAASKEDGGCGITEEDLTNLVGDGFNNKAKNAVKGTFYEALMAFSVRVLAGDGEAAKKDLVKVIKEKKAILTAILKDVDEQAGTGLDEAFDLTVQRELLDEISSEKSFFDGVMRELRSTGPFVQFMAADGVRETGKVSKTGQRADLIFTYKDKKTAEAKAKAIGSSIKKLEDGSYGVPVGLKRIDKLHGTKFGEINSQTRMLGLITGEISDDKNLDAGFQESMTQRQFGSSDTPRQTEMISFAQELEAEIGEATNQLVEDKTYVDSNGKIKSQTPEGVLRQLANKVTSLLSFDKQSTSILSKAFFDLNDDGENVLKDFEGEGPNAFSNRQRAREKVARCARFNRLKKEVEAGNMAAMDYIVKGALVCGSNTDDLGQVIVENSGDMQVIKHNEVFDRICKAMNDPENPPEFNFTESGVTISVGGLAVKYSQEGTDGAGDTRDTRSEARITLDTLRNSEVQGDIRMPQNNSSFEEYVKAHIKLLETFLS
jgi:hypothetical protein